MRFYWAGYEQVPCQVAGLVPRGDGPGQFNRRDFVPKAQDRGVTTAGAYALAATQEALNNAGWKPRSAEDCQRTGGQGWGMGGGAEQIGEVGGVGDQLQKKIVYCYRCAGNVIKTLASQTSS
jgi:3-oxoacyl-[acyl-carrier-protein] synthase II